MFDKIIYLFLQCNGMWSRLFQCQFLVLLFSSFVLRFFVACGFPHLNVCNVFTEGERAVKREMGKKGKKVSEKRKTDQKKNRTEK